MSEEVKIVQISEDEYRIKDNKIRIIEGNIIFIEPQGEQTDSIAKAHLEHNNMLSRQISGNLNYLINLNRAGKSSPVARKVWQKISELPVTNKVALFGIHPVARILATFVIGVTSKKEIRFFNNETEALAWISS